ncbi:Protease Do-like 7 [Linum grandiflorum]
MTWQLSIMAGTIARLDREAPCYTDDGYNDFNTVYIQAASGTKGGSSGSPVIEKHGRAVALNAGGGIMSSSAFFLPLERVIRALKLLQEGNHVYKNLWNAVCIPRGTLQTTFYYKGFNEVCRLGVKKDIEQMVRHVSPDETGMLVVESVVPDGPAYEHLEAGDVLIRVNGEITTKLLTLEAILDDHVDQKVELQIERGGKTLTVDITVQNLHSITPDYFLEVSGAVMHSLSYQQARNFRLPCGLVYVAHPGYILERAGVPRTAIIKKFANVETTTMKELIPIFAKLAKGSKVPLEYINPGDRHRLKQAAVTIEKHEWHASPMIYTRDDCSGLWKMVPAFQTDTTNNKSTVLSNEEPCSPITDLTEMKDSNNGTVPTKKNVDYLGHNHIVNSFPARSLIEPTLVMFEVVFLHPVYNYAIVAYNPSALGTDGASMVRAAQLLPAPLLCHGDPVCLVGLNDNLVAIGKRAIVTNPFQSLFLQSAQFLHYKAINMEVVEIDSDLGITAGVLCNELGMVHALWGSFYTHVEPGNMLKNQVYRGIPIYMVSHVVHEIVHGSFNNGPGPGPGPGLVINGIRRSMPLVRLLEVEFFPRSLSKARSFGLDDYWIDTLFKKDPMRKQVLRVKGCYAGSKAASPLTEGDMLLAINREPVTSFLDVENACKALDDDDHLGHENSNGLLHLTIFRQGREIKVDVETEIKDGNGTRRMINWSGCIIQETFSTVRARGYLPTNGHGVYVVTIFTGSPAERYSVRTNQWIVEVNGNLTPNLDVFLDVVKELEQHEFVRMKTVSLDGKPQVLTLKQDLLYWPTEELNYDSDTETWKRHTIKIFT